MRDVWPFVQLFVDNVSSTKLTLNEFEFGSCTVIANWQPYVTEERLPTYWRGRVSVSDRQRQSGHRQRPPGTTTWRFRTTWPFWTTWQFRTTGPPHNLSSTPPLSRWTCRRVISPSVQAADAAEGSFRTASLRCAAPTAPLLVTALCLSPFCRYFFWLLHRFLHTSRPVGTINRVTVFSFVRAVYYWPYCTAVCFVRISRSSKLLCFSHRVINFKS